MTSPDPDPSATLEAIKARAKSAAAMDIDVLAAFEGVSVGGVIAASAVDVPRLVAALDAVLKLAAGWEEDGNEFQWCARALTEAITREITGKGERDGG